VLAEFQSDNFVVKRSGKKFNQVDPERAREFLNFTGKVGGEIVGITKTPSALSRWALSFNVRSVISSATYAMFKLCPLGIRFSDESIKIETVTRNKMSHKSL
jgi:hypothetical protein